MKYKIFTLFFGLLFTNYSFPQSTAMDFTMSDCNGQMHNLFSELDQNQVIIIEFFMLNCGSCIVAGDKLKPMYAKLEQEFPGKVKFYHIGYRDDYSCTDINDWVTTNGYNSTPFDSGAAQVAYYGGMGMPTVVVVGGNQHEVLFLANQGFATSDTAVIATATRDFFAQTNGIPGSSSSDNRYHISPNPASETATIELTLKEATGLKIQLVNINGQIIREIFNEKTTGADFHIGFGTAELNDGIYFLKIEANRVVNYRKLIVSH